MHRNAIDSAEPVRPSRPKGRLSQAVRGFGSVLAFAANLGAAINLQASAAQIALPPSPVDTANYRVVKVAERVYAFIAPDGITPAVSGNSTVVIGDSAVLVIDTGQYPAVARWEIGRIRALTPLPVRYVVNTHWHPDHWLGNAEFLAVFPEAEILSTAATLEAMRTRGAPYISPAAAEKTVAQLRKMLESDGAGMAEPARRWYGYGLAQLEALLPDLRTLHPAYPSRIVAESLTLSLGGGPIVELRFLGRGNTAGDLVAYLPRTRTLVTGDLVVHPYPYGFGSFIGEWADVVRRLEAFDPRAIVPGHGAVERDGVYLAAVGSILADLQAAARGGATAEDAVARAGLPRYQARLCGDNEFCRYGLRSSFESLVGRAWREVREGPLTDEK